MRWQRAFLVVTVCVADCSDPPPVDTAVTAANFSSKYASALCDALFRCPVVGESGSVVSLLASVPARCAGAVEDVGARDLERMVSAGAVRFDAAAARACLDRAAQGCAITTASLGALCPTVYTGTATRDGECWRQEQCATGFYCDHDGAARRCPGVCVPQLAVNGACTTDRECLGQETGAVVCHFGACAAITDGPAAAESAPCGQLDDATGTMVTRVACAAGLTCLDGTCRRPIAEGARCASGDACAPNTVCTPDPTSVAHANTCQRATRRVRSVAGGVCSRDDSGAAPTCNPLAYLACNAENTCAPAGDGTLGSPCIRGGGLLALTCGATLRCDDATARCALRRRLGEACLRGSDCQLGFCEGGRCIEHLCQ